MKKNLLLMSIFLLILTGCGASLSTAQENAQTFIDNVDSGASFEYHIENSSGESQTIVRDAKGNIKIEYSSGEVDYLIDGKFTICIEDTCEESVAPFEAETKIQEVTNAIKDSLSGTYETKISNVDNGIEVKMDLTDMFGNDEIVGTGIFTFNDDGTEIDYNFDCTQDEETFTCFDYTESAVIKDIEDIILP